MPELEGTEVGPAGGIEVGHGRDRRGAAVVVAEDSRAAQCQEVHQPGVAVQLFTLSEAFTMHKCVHEQRNRTVIT